MGHRGQGLWTEGRTNGARSYIYQYRLGGREAKVRRHTIGAHGRWTPDAARQEAKRLAQLIDQGKDPSALEQERRRDQVDLAFPNYAERFIEEYLKENWKGGHELASGILRRSVMPTLQRKTLKELKRRDIATVMDKLKDRPATRRNAFAVLRRLFRWAVNRGDIDVSPMRDLDAPPAPASRDRVLSDEELKRVWCGSGEIGYPFGPFTKLLILTGQRRDEVAKLEWSELDRNDAVWTLPAQRSKNGAAHQVPLSPQAVAVFDLLATLAGSKGKWPRRGFVFTMKGDKAVAGYSVAKRRLDTAAAKAVAADAQSNGSPIPPWRFHDLRRTLATGLQRLGVRFEVTEAVLNHVSGSRAGVAGVYQRYGWATEKREALDAWARHVESIVAR